MKRHVIETLLRGKLQIEIWRYKREILDCEPEEIYARAYEIDHMTELYVILTETIEVMSEEALQILLGMNDVIQYMYERWMRVPDERTQEMETCIWNAVGLTRERVESKTEVISY